jgi:alpha-galactosidase
MVLAKKPPMGWNSWNTFGANIDHELICQTADVMAKEGYLEAGYDTLVIDDGWQAYGRSADGHLLVDEKRFPYGMKAVADYVHSKGLKFGIYSAAGVKTCQERPGSYGYEYIDAQDFADWGVDFLKYDLCRFSGSANMISAYFTMSMALKATGRDIVYSVASNGEGEPMKWARAIGAHMYRSTGDIQDCFESIRRIALSQLDVLSESATGCYNDPDMLTVGMHGKGYAANGGCSIEEYWTHFGIWCMYSVPLMLGADLRTLDAETKALLLNKDLIAINQDEESRVPYFEKNVRCGHKNKLVLFKMLADNRFALGFFNMNDTETRLDAFFTDYGMPARCGYGLRLKDVRTGEDVGVHKDYFSVNLQPHTCKIYIGTMEK